MDPISRRGFMRRVTVVTLGVTRARRRSARRVLEPIQRSVARGYFGAARARRDDCTGGRRSKADHGRGASLWRAASGAGDQEWAQRHHHRELPGRARQEAAVRHRRGRHGQASQRRRTRSTSTSRRSAAATTTPSYCWRCSGNSGPDVTHVGGDSIGEMVDAGYLAPLDDYVAKWDDWKNYPDAVKQGVTYKGKVYGIPYGLDTRFLYYRKDVFQKAGLDANWQPKNLQDILDTARTVQGKVPDVIPYVIYAGKNGDTGTANHGFVPTLWGFGGDLQDKSGKWIGDSPALRKTLTYYQDAYQKSKLVPSEVLTSPKPWTAMREKEGNGGLALLFEGGWVYGGWAGNDAAATTQNIGYVLYPTEAGGAVVYRGRARDGVDDHQPVQEQGPGVGVHQDVEQQGHRRQVEY